MKFLLLILLCSFLFEITSNTIFVKQEDNIENMEKEEQGKKENDPEVEDQPKIVYSTSNLKSNNLNLNKKHSSAFFCNFQKLKSTFIYSIDLPPESI